MKSIVKIFIVMLCVAFASSADAQMSKKEAKEWKKRIKKLTPEQYQTLLQENKSLKSQVSSLKKEVSGAGDKASENDRKIEQYETRIAELKDALKAAQKAQASRPKAESVVTSVEGTKGVVFTVQIGAFAKKDLRKFAENNPAFQADTTSGLMKYTIGLFRDYWEADTFKKYLREIGVKDAFIAPYKDGKRVPIKEVLEGVI